MKLIQSTQVQHVSLNVLGGSVDVVVVVVVVITVVFLVVKILGQGGVGMLGALVGNTIGGKGSGVV